MTELQCYRKLYGDLIKSVPHYKNRVDLQIKTIQACRDPVHPGEVLWIEEFKDPCEGLLTRVYGK